MSENRTRELKTFTKRLLLRPAYFLNTSFFYTARLSFACSRGAMNAATRKLDPSDTRSWEFSAFSQNGEDGIIDYLLSLVREPNRYFVEVGASDGLENNSSYLAFVKKHNGVMVDGNQFKSANAERFLQALNWGVDYLNMFITPDAVSGLLDRCIFRDPDFFSLDIDSNDYYVCKACLEAGLRPKVICVEYNSALGPERSITIPYTPEFDYTTAHPSGLYYGVSLNAWKTFLSSHGFRFVTVDTHGVNAFFVDPATVDTDALSGLHSVDFAENSAQRRRVRGDWRAQFSLIESLPYVTVT